MTEIDWKKLGQVLEEECKKRGLSWRKLKREAGFAFNTTEGIFKNPAERKLKTLARLAQVLEIPLSELIRRAEKEKK